MANKTISILNTKTDNQLVNLACNNNKAALEILLLRYNSKTMILIHRYIDNAADVQDISQEVLIKLSQSLALFSYGSSFKTWHYRIVINTINSYFRKPYYRYSSQAVNYENFDNHSAQLLENVDPQELLIAQQSLISLNLVFKKMPAQLIEVMQFFEIDGISYQEIAKRLKCPIGTVRSRIYRARIIIEHALAG